MDKINMRPLEKLPQLPNSLRVKVAPNFEREDIELVSRSFLEKRCIREAGKCHIVSFFCNQECLVKGLYFKPSPRCRKARVENSKPCVMVHVLVRNSDHNNTKFPSAEQRSIYLLFHVAFANIES
jgi:hypothetical protein